jgi:AcrR family transcriptional regulator
VTDPKMREPKSLRRPLDESPESVAPRRRDAAKTQQRLLEAARRRFALDGYAATTVRDIADDVDVNVALINRYFGSKEGLFEACLEAAVRDLGRSTDQVQGLSQVVEAISQGAVRASSEGGMSEVLLLLLRSSGDERAEQKRIGMLHRFGSRLASAAGWTPDRPSAGELLLRAQLVLSAAVGVVVLRSWPGLEPLGSATEQQLSGPLHDLVMGVLGRDDDATPIAGNAIVALDGARDVQRYA